MDDRLRQALSLIEKQIKALRHAEEKFLTLEVAKKAKYSIAYLSTSGTVAEREATVLSSADWGIFTKALIDAEVSFNFEKRKLEHHMKAFDAEYLTYKLEHGAINRQGSIT